MNDGNRKMISCPTCGEEIAKSAKVCPKCGAKMKKPWYKKWWVWVIVVVVLINIGNGDKDHAKNNGSSSPAISRENITETVQTQPNVVSGNQDVEANIESTQADIANTDKVLWESNGIKVTYKGIEEKYGDIDIKVLIENNSVSNQRVSVESLDINGFTMSSGLSLYAEVNAGKKTNDNISIYSTDLENNGINGLSDIKDIEIILKARDTDTYDSVISDPIRLEF